MINYPKMMSDAYPILLNLIVKLVNKKAGEKILPGDEWQNDAQTLAIKLFKHLASMKSLSNGTRFSSSEKTPLSYIDHGSIIVLARAALETYLVWHYLYGQTDLELSKFRYFTWKLGGLMDRQKLKTVSLEGHKVQETELIEIGLLKEKIITFPQYNKFTKNKQKNLLQGDWKAALGTADIAVAAGFHGTYFRNIYSYLCGYAHANYISALQIGQAKSLGEQEKISQGIMGVGLVTTAHFVCSYAKHFPETSTVLEANPKEKSIAEYWALMAEDMDSAYGSSTT